MNIITSIDQICYIDRYLDKVSLFKEFKTIDNVQTKIMTNAKVMMKIRRKTIVVDCKAERIA